MSKKILIIGSKGMAGHMIRHFLKEQSNYSIVDIARNNESFEPKYILDVTDFDALKKIISVEKPDVVINCVGVLNKDAETNPDKAILLNAYLPHMLGMYCTTIGSKLIHFSTDCVFSGSAGSYTETDIKNGEGFYAQSKALGEVNYGNHLTIRTSIIGPELKNGIGLFHWFMNQKGDIKGYSQAYWSGVTTTELAKAVYFAIEHEISGLYHLVNNMRINKYELLLIFKEVFNRTDITIHPYDQYKIDKSLINKRNDFNYFVPSYLEMVTDMKKWIDDHAPIYSGYHTNSK